METVGDGDVQKYVVIDGKIVIVESANWATTSIPNPGHSAWEKGNREWFVAMADARFTELFASLEEHGLVDSLRALDPKFFTHCHNKGVIIDGHIVVVSSTNWSNDSIAAGREAGVLIDREDVVAYYAEVFTLDWESGIPWDQVMDTLEATPQGLGSEEETIHPADLA